VRHLVRRHLFLLIGVLTLNLFFLEAGLDRAGKVGMAHALAGPMRVLIVPVYFVWLLLTMAQVAIAAPVPLPAPFTVIVWCLDMIAGLAPYALVDYLLNRLRRTGTRN
jgi:hypothetical protein